jgi:hypothetical protein
MTGRILTLIKKDILLTECYLILTGLILIAFPIFINCTIKGFMSSDYFLFITIDFAAFLMFSQIYLMESKCSGSTWIVASPYSRHEILLSRYILLFLICMSGAAIYKILEIINPAYIFSGAPRITFAQMVFSVSLVLICYDFILPLLNFFPYEKVKITFALVSVFIPLWGSLLIKSLLGLKDITVSVVPITNKGAILLIVVDIILFICSLMANRYLWEKKEF